MTEEEKIERAQNRLRGILSEMPVRKALLGDYITVETLQKHVRNTTGLGTAFVAGALGYFVVETTEEMRWKRARLEFRDDTIYLYNPKKFFKMEDVVYYETKKDDSNKTVYYIVNKDEDVMVFRI